MSDMTFEEYIDRFGMDMDELAVALMRRVEYLDPVRKEEILRALQPEGRSASQDNLLNLMEEARENLELARRLRNSVTGQGGQLLGTVSEVSKVIMAADKALESASKRFQAIFSITTFRAVEECVCEVLAEMDQDTADRFLATLEERLKGIR